MGWFDTLSDLCFELLLSELWEIRDWFLARNQQTFDRVMVPILQALKLGRFCFL